MSDNIRLHPKHGLNPPCCTCFWCGEDTREIALLGAAYKGEAPMHMVLNYEPCAACKEQFAKGITLIETTTRPAHNQPPIDGTHYPTGRIAVVTEESIPRIFDEESATRILRSRKALIDPAAWGKLGLSK